MGAKLYDFAVLKFNQDYLFRLDPIHLYYLVNGNLAANDISVLAKIFLASMGNCPTDVTLAEIYNLNHLVLRRLFSSKVYEIIDLFECYAVKIKRSRLADEHSFAGSLTSAVTQWKSERAYSHVDYIRNNVTNHYAVRDCLEKARLYSQDHKFQMILANQSGNSYSPLAEQVAHLSQFENFEGDLTATEVDEWLRDNAPELIRWHHKINAKIMEAYPLPEGRARRVWVENKLVGTKEDVLPILHFEGDRSRFRQSCEPVKND